LLPINFALLTGQFPIAPDREVPSVAHRGQSPRKTSRFVSKSAHAKTRAGSGKGQALFNINCAPCHQLGGGGNLAFHAPALAGQHDWYLARQLN
jgi:cytochrome c553